LKLFLKTVASLLVVSFTALVVMVNMPLPAMPQSGISGDFLLRNVHIVDVHTGTLHKDRDIVVREGAIHRIADSGQIAPSDDLTELEGGGKYAIPGLWDMHTHSTKLASQYLHPLFLANGITGVREMWGCMSEPDSYIACQDDRLRWNHALSEGKVTSPRFVLHSSFQINGGNEVPVGYPEYFKARTEDEANQLAVYYANTGVDFLKIYSELPLTGYTALAVKARLNQLDLAGHRPLSVSLPELISAGQRSVEHPRLFLLECYRGAAAFRALSEPLSAFTMDLRRKLIEEHDEQACGELMAVMADSQTAWTPTIQVLGMSARAGDSEFRMDPHLKYIPWPLREGMWLPDANNAVTKSLQPGHGDTYSELYELASRHVGQAHEAGVEILLGTDAGDTYIFPGFAVHDELQEFVRAGIPPADALRIATLGAARFSGLDSEFGSIEVGKAGDILLLESNPLLDIGATRQINALMFSGQFFSRAALDELLRFAESQASSIRFNLQLLWSLVNSPIVRVQFAD
jgi:hypothetical protein